VQRLLKELLAALDEAYHRPAEARDLQSRRLFHVKTKKGRSPRNPGFVADGSRPRQRQETDGILRVGLWAGLHEDDTFRLASTELRITLLPWVDRETRTLAGCEERFRAVLQLLFRVAIDPQLERPETVRP